MKVLIATVNSKYAHTSLGIYAVAGYLRALTEHEILIEEYTIQTPILTILANIYPHRPQVLGLAMYIWNKNEILQLAALVKKVLPTCKIILGGPEASFNSSEILKHNPAIDYIVMGEGEQSMRELLEALECNKSLPLSVATYEHIGSEIAMVENLDELPFVYKLLPHLDLDNHIVYYESSRGCPYRCSYCLSGISRMVRKRSLHKVFEELQWFIDKNVRQVKFVDRTYNLDINHYLPIMQFLAQAKTTTNFHFEIKADNLTQEVIEFLKSVPKGRFQFEVGIQSTHSETLEAINRQNDFKKICNNIAQILSFENIHVHVDLIAGLPYEDYATFQKSFNQVYALQADMLQLGFLKILHGSIIEQQILEHDYQYMPAPPYEVVANKYINYEELRRLKLIEDLVEKYYNSGKYKKSIKSLVALFGNAFDFYEQFAIFVEQSGKYLQSFGDKTNTVILLDFIKTKLPTIYLELEEMVHLDVFTQQYGWRQEVFVSKIEDKKEEFLEFFRNETVLKKYLPEYITAPWRQIKKYYPMEIFNIDNREVIYILLMSSNRLIEVDERDFYGSL